MITFSVKWDVFFRIDSQINAFHSFKKKKTKNTTRKTNRFCGLLLRPIIILQVCILEFIYFNQSKCIKGEKAIVLTYNIHPKLTNRT